MEGTFSPGPTPRIPRFRPSTRIAWLHPSVGRTRGRSSASWHPQGRRDGPSTLNLARPRSLPLTFSRKCPVNSVLQTKWLERRITDIVCSKFVSALHQAAWEIGESVPTGGCAGATTCWGAGAIQPAKVAVNVTSDRAEESKPYRPLCHALTVDQGKRRAKARCETVRWRR